MIVRAYCCGNIPKGHSTEGTLSWSSIERTAVTTAADPIDVRFLDPNDPLDKHRDPALLFGRDMFHVRAADLVIVDGRERRGLGVGVEMLAAKLFRTALLAVVPDNSHYKADELLFRGAAVKDYVHPHVWALSDAIVPDFRSAGLWIRDVLARGFKPRGFEALYSAVDLYEQFALDDDETTRKVLTG